MLSHRWVHRLLFYYFFPFISTPSIVFIEYFALGQPPSLHRGLCAQTDWLTSPVSLIPPLPRLTGLNSLIFFPYDFLLHLIASDLILCQRNSQCLRNWVGNRKKRWKKKDRRRPPPSYRIMMEDESINFHVDIDNWTHSRQPQNDSTQHVHTMHTVHSCRHSVLAPEQNATAWLHVFCCSVTLDMHQTEDEQNRGGKKWKENPWIETAILLLHSIWILQTKCAYSIWSECLPLLSSQSNLFKRRTEVELWCTKYAFENAE